jgi:putative ABC transport system permease protein
VAEWLSSLGLRLRALLRRRRLEQDFQDEVAFHLAMREEQLRTSGTIDADAAARRRFGRITLIREELREIWAFAPSVAALLRDFRYAARTLRRSPGFATVVILTIGLGIGANTALFSVVNAVLIRPLGYTDADRLMSLLEGFPHARIDRLPFSALDFEDFRTYQQSFEAVAAYRNVPFELSGSGVSERIVGAKVSAELFRTLGVDPAVGRAFSTAEDRPGGNVAILSWGLWQRRYAAAPAIVGQSIHLDRQPYTVVGIMSAGFVFPRRGLPFGGEPADVWVPIAFTDRERAERGSMHNNNVIARLESGVSFEAAQAELDVLAKRIAANYPIVVLKAGFAPGLFGQPLRKEISGRFERPLLMLLAAVGLVLLIACANVANLILSRGASRTREFAVRTALGACRAQLVHLFLGETLLLSGAGGLVGLTIAYWAVNAAPVVVTRMVPGLHDLTIDVRVLGFTALMCLGTALIFALLPLVTLGRRHPGDSLRQESRTTSGSAELHLQRGFVVLTVSLACVLLVGAGVFIRSFATLVATDVGFRPAHVLTASMTLPRTFYTTGASVRTFHQSLSRNLSTLPGVRSVAIATDLPLTTYEHRAFTPEGMNISDGAQPTTSLTWVHGPYFETLGITLVRGRFFVPDEYVHERRVVIVNEKLAALAWSGQDPLGKRLKWGGSVSAAPWLTVVGVIRNVVDGPIGAPPTVHAYEPFRQLPDFFLDGATNQFGRDLEAVLLADGDPRAVAALVRQEIAKLDRELAIESIEPMEAQVNDVVAPQRVSTVLVGAFAAIALLLASVGLYGLLAYTIAQRRREMAVRIALGAGRHTVMGMMVGQGARLVATGLVAGLIGSLVLTRLVASLLYQTNPYDPVTLITVPAVLAVVAFIACALPAWRAARVDPIIALRAE